MNKSALLMFAVASLTVLLVSQLSSEVFADVSSPKKQTKIGIDHTDIICKANLVKVYRINADSTDCFTPSTAQKLMDKGIAKEIPKDKMEAKKSFKQNSPIGTVTSLSTVKQFGAEGKLSTNLRVVEYVHVFEVCANDKTIRAPEILVKSDSEAKTVKLAQKIVANTCYTNSAKIKATDVNSISASLTNKGAISDKLTELEAKIIDIQKKLVILKKNLSDTAKQDTTVISEDAKKKISDTTNEISKLRAELNLAKGELNKYLFALYAPPQLKASDFTKQKLTFTGVPIKDTSANIMSISKQVTGTKDQSSTFGDLSLYNVVFEACTGKDVLRAPEVKVTSDSEEKTIQISERIIANSCQMSAAKINAKDTKSITLEIANRADISVKITDLEKKIDSLIVEQSKYQMELNKLVVQSDKPADYEQKVSELSSKIIQLRNEIRDAKFQLHGSMYEIYKK
ncbi:MAG: hypothetical protein OEL84_01370 [Nitrosopumilus sp.]|nr:hypothetical protein [Nitrosopumilus sp.]